MAEGGVSRKQEEGGGKGSDQVTRDNGDLIPMDLHHGPLLV